MSGNVRRMAGGLNHLIGGGGVGMTILGAIDVNSVQVWAGALVAAGAVLWGFIREQKQRDFDNAEKRRLMQTLIEANVKAIEAGGQPPFPEVLQLVTGMSASAGVEVKQKPTGISGGSVAS